MEHKLTDIDTIRSFVLAGRAVFTIRSATSGKHYTFKVLADKKDPIHWVHLMTGADHFEYLGYIKADQYRISPRSCRQKAAPSHLCMEYLLAAFNSRHLHPKMEFFHEGRCGRCGRPLTDPESIQRGLGPTCAGR